MKKIKVIFTGGTIGSLSSGDDINTSEETRYLLFQKYGELNNECKKNVEKLDPICIMQILSENALFINVIAMASEIKKIDNSDVDGIIITHGSDTLAHTSAYLSFLLNDIKVPVIMVASNYVLTNEKANGVVNFAAAIDLINIGIQPGVYVAYKNPEDEYVSIHLGCRVREPMSMSDSFYSPTGYRFATWNNGNLKFENTNIQKDKKNFNFGNKFTKSALFIHPFTGLNYNDYKNKNFDYVVHELYHGGTANTQNYIDETFDTNLLNFIDYCNVKKIPIYLCNILKKDVNYNSTNQMLKKNVNILYNVLTNVALAKINIANNLLNETQRDEFIKANIAGEILD